MLRQRSARKNLVWAITGAGLTILWDWNWQLVLATGIGSGSMLSVYLFMDWDWSSYWQQGQRFLHKPLGKLTVAVTAGSLAAISTYMAAVVLTDSDNTFMAIASLVQLLGTMVILVLLIGQQKQQGKREDAEVWLWALSDRDPLKRLIAVRHLAEKSTTGQITEYLQLMLTQEEHPQVRKAIEESLGEKPLEPLQLPIQVRQTRKLPD